jgi:hypothetical protein
VNYSDTPYAIEIFVADGRSDGLKLVSSRNWTGIFVDIRSMLKERQKDRCLAG